MNQSGCFEWPVFQRELIAAINRWESAHEAGESFSYYTCWLQALESLLDRLDVVGSAQLVTRVAEQRSRPTGHDHDHARDHARQPGG
jgi:hypothetical protein